MSWHARLAGLLGLVVAAVAAPAERAGATEWDGSYFPNVTLLTQTGEPVKFYDDLIAGKLVVINFIYTECPDICGLATARMARIAEWLSDRIGRDIFFYSISLDPKTDTPEKLAAYAKAFGVPDGWLFLTGDPADVELVSFKLGERSESLNSHRVDMVLGNGATGEWRRASLMGSLQTAASEILEMDPAWRPEPVTASADATMPEVGFAMESRPGEGFFLQACAACHSIGDGDRIGPDLAGLTLRRDHDWIVRYMMAPQEVRASGDPVAAALTARFPGVRMPNLSLGESDVDDLLAYLQSEMDRLDAAAEAAEGAAAMPEHHVHAGEGHAAMPDADGAMHDMHGDGHAHGAASP